MPSFESSPWPADLYFGDAEQPLPDWRAAAPAQEDADDDDDAPLTAEERQALVALLGFDPGEENEDDRATGGSV